jgi:hypothetical protein
MSLNAVESVEAVWHHDKSGKGNVEENLFCHSVSHCPWHVTTHGFDEVGVFNNWNSNSINEKEFIHQNRGGYMSWTMRDRMTE